MATDVQATDRAVTPGSTAHRRLDIQGLRAIAVLLVVAFHAELPIPGGFVGVDVFFVISGFVITAMLAREWAMHGRLRFGTFYLRRFLRLTPALALVVAVVAVASILLQNPFGAQQTTARTGLGAMLLSANYVIGHAAGDYFAAGAVTNPLLHTWSLSVEEQFYLAFPALLVLAWALVRRGRSRALPVALVAVIAALSFALSAAWSFGWTGADGLTSFFGGAESFAFYSSITRAWEFAAGALLALVLHRLPVFSRRTASITGVVGAVLVGIAAFTIHDSQPFPGVVALIPVVGTVLLLLAGTHHVTGVSRALSTRPMVAIGDLSYSWYLWHWPLIVFTALLFPGDPLALVLAAALSLLPAVLSYRLLEQPLRRLRPRSRPRAGALVLVVTGIPIALCLGLLAGANSGWGLTPPAATTAATAAMAPSVTTTTGESLATDTASENIATTESVDGDGEVAGGEGGSLRAQHDVVRAGCVNTDLDPVRCRFGPATATGTVLLAGDSQAYALGNGVIAAAERLGLDTVATSRTGCPFLARESSGTHNYPCRDWQQSVVEWALAERPAAVVIANRSAGYVHPEWGWRTAARDDGTRARSTAEATDLWRAGLEPIVQQLSDAGIPVVVAAAVPEMTGYVNRTSLLGGSIGDAFEVSRADSVADRAPALEVEQDLADEYPGVAVFDPIPVLCGSETCSTERDGQPIYQDETHLSVGGAVLLTDGLAEAISSAVSAGSPQPR